MSYTQQLHQLQQIDSQIEAITARLEDIAASLVESAALKSAKIAFAEAQTAYRHTRTLVTDLDLEVKGVQQKIAHSEQRLYSGKMINPKEASALQDEIAANKRWLAKREEDLLEAMIQDEEAEITYQERQETLTQIQAQWEADQADLLTEQTERQNELQALTKSRGVLAQLINQADLADYDRLRHKLGGVGLAEVEDGICSACGVMLSSRLVQLALADSQLYNCESCGRIIHIL